MEVCLDTAPWSEHLLCGGVCLEPSSCELVPQAAEGWSWGPGLQSPDVQALDFAQVLIDSTSWARLTAEPWFHSLMRSALSIALGLSLGGNLPSLHFFSLTVK